MGLDQAAINSYILLMAEKCQTVDLVLGVINPTCRYLAMTVFSMDSPLSPGAYDLLCQRCQSNSCSVQENTAYVF